MIRGLLAGSFWGLVVGGLVLVIAALAIDRWREPPPDPIEAQVVATAPSGLDDMPAMPVTPQPPVRTHAAEVAFGAPELPLNPQAIAPRAAKVTLAPEPRRPSPAADAEAASDKGVATEPPALPEPATERATISAAAAPSGERGAPEPDRDGALPPNLAGLPAETGESLSAAAPATPAFPAGILPGAGEGALPADATPGGATAVAVDAQRRGRIAFVVVAEQADADALPAWVRTVATEEGSGPAGTETLRALADGWRDIEAAGAPILFPDRADPGPFLAARAAGRAAWLAYDRIERATPDLGLRLSAARERARRDGAVAVILADDPALLAGVSDWLAAEGDAAPDPVPVSGLH